MINLIEIFLLLILGIITGCIGAITGMGGVIGIPSLILFGLSPAQSIANLKLASLGLNIFAIRNFIKSKKVIWKYFLPFLIIIIITTILNAIFIIKLPSFLLNIIVTTLLIFVMILILLNPDTGIKKKKTNIRKKKKGYFFLSLATFFGTFIGGLGILKYFIVSKYFGLKYIEANASLRIPWFISSIILTIIFITQNLINYTIAAPLLIGNMIGGYIGSKIQIEKGELWVKKIFLITLLIITIIKVISFISNYF